MTSALKRQFEIERELWEIRLIPLILAATFEVFIEPAQAGNRPQIPTSGAVALSVDQKGSIEGQRIS